MSDVAIEALLDATKQAAEARRERDEALARLDGLQRRIKSMNCVCDCYGCCKQGDCCTGCKRAVEILKANLETGADRSIDFMDGIIKLAKNEIEMLKELLDEACNLAEQGLSILLPGTNLLTPVFAADKMARVLEIRQFQSDRYRHEERKKRFGK